MTVINKGTLSWSFISSKEYQDMTTLVSDLYQKNMPNIGDSFDATQFAESTNLFNHPFFVSLLNKYVNLGRTTDDVSNQYGRILKEVLHADTASYHQTSSTHKGERNMYTRIK